LDPLLIILAVSYIDNANLKSSLTEIFENLLKSEGVTDELTCDNMMRGLSKLDITYDEPGSSSCAKTIHIHMTKMDYDTITEHGALAKANGALGAAEFDNVMRKQVHGYIKTKLQRSIRDTETQREFSSLATLKLLVNEMECLKDTLSRSMQTDLSRSMQSTCVAFHTPRMQRLGTPRVKFHRVQEDSYHLRNPLVQDQNIFSEILEEDEQESRQKQQSLLALLREWKLEGEAERLAENGVCEMEDLEFMKDEDLAKFGLRLKFRGLLQHVAEQQKKRVSDGNKEQNVAADRLASGGNGDGSRLEMHASPRHGDTTTSELNPVSIPCVLDQRYHMLNKLMLGVDTCVCLCLPRCLFVFVCVCL